MTATVEYQKLPEEAKARQARWMEIIAQLTDNITEMRRVHAAHHIPGYDRLNDVEQSKVLTDDKHLIWYSIAVRLPRHVGVPHFLSSLISPAHLVIVPTAAEAKELLRSATAGYRSPGTGTMFAPTTEFLPSQVEHHVLGMDLLQQQFENGEVHTRPEYHHLDRVYVLSDVTRPLTSLARECVASFSRLGGCIPFLVFIET